MKIYIYAMVTSMGKRGPILNWANKGPKVAGVYTKC